MDANQLSDSIEVKTAASLVKYEGLLLGCVMIVLGNTAFLSMTQIQPYFAWPPTTSVAAWSPALLAIAAISGMARGYLKTLSTWQSFFSANS